MIIQNREQQREIIGLIPAAGQATRLSPLPVSKEIYPIGFRTVEDGSIRPKAVCHYLLENMRLAGIRKAYFLLRPGKWDIPAYLGDGAIVDMHLGYLIVRLLDGVPYTLDHAYPFVRDVLIAVGYPDILFQPKDAYKRLLIRQEKSGADLVLGAVPFENPQKGGMIEFDSTGRVFSILEKPLSSNSKYSFCTLVWTPVFTEFMHHYLETLELNQNQSFNSRNTNPVKEVIFADVIQAAINQGLHIEAEVLQDGSYLDIGTPDDLIKATKYFSLQETNGSTDNSQNLNLSSSVLKLPTNQSESA